jgi:hypothetical protein
LQLELNQYLFSLPVQVKAKNKQIRAKVLNLSGSGSENKNVLSKRTNEKWKNWKTIAIDLFTRKEFGRRILLIYWKEPQGTRINGVDDNGIGEEERQKNGNTAERKCTCHFR